MLGLGHGLYHSSGGVDGIGHQGDDVIVQTPLPVEQQQIEEPNFPTLQTPNVVGDLLGALASDESLALLRDKFRYEVHESDLQPKEDYDFRRIGVDADAEIGTNSLLLGDDC